MNRRPLPLSVYVFAFLVGVCIGATLGAL